jgi:hypothetical protein
MTTSELMDEDREALRDALDAALDDDSMKMLKKKASDLAETITEDIEWSLKQNLADRLSWHVADMAERAINALLEGNESEMIRWLKCDKRGYNGRSDGYTGPNFRIEGQHPIIHGVLHENSTVALRRKIFEVHRDLIENQRIADLEDQVKSLVAQVNDADRKREAMWERVRAAEGVF